MPAPTITGWRAKSKDCRITAEPGSPAPRPVAVISHERSGTHLCIDSLRLFFRETYTKQLPFQSTHRLYWDLHERLREPLPLLVGGLREAPGRPLLKLHFEPDMHAVADLEFRNAYRELLARSDRVYVVRDGRDVLVSYFRFRQQFDQGTTEFSHYLRSPFRPDGRTVARYWSDHVTGWLVDPSIHVVQFESMRSEYATAVAGLGAALGLTRNSRPIRSIKMDTPRFLRAVKRALGLQSSSAILPGSGQTGGWRTHFSTPDIELFKREAGQTLIDLGYERDMDW